jgi:hypothetical protein
MKKKEWNLQLFADGDGGAEANTAGVTPATDHQEASEVTANPFDEFLKDPKNQAEFDRRLNKALQTREVNLTAQHKQALADAKKEAEKVAGMTAAQKLQHEMDQLKQENERLKEAQLRVELGRTASGLLKDQKIEATEDVLDLVIGPDEETTKANIEKLSGVIQAHLKAAEVERAKGTTPKQYGGNTEETSELAKRIAKYRKE